MWWQMACIPFCPVLPTLYSPSWVKIYPEAALSVQERRSDAVGREKAEMKQRQEVQVTRERDKREGLGFAVTAWRYRKNSERMGFARVHLEVWSQTGLSGKQASWRDRPNFVACISISHCRSLGHWLKTQIPKPSPTQNVKPSKKCPEPGNGYPDALVTSHHTVQH